jgi:hypothetical protein
LRGLLRIYVGSFRDLVPIVLVIGFFQIVVLQQPFPDLERVLTGLVFVVVGLSLFVQGLEIGLFPLGESMAGAFARKGSLAALFAFAFCLGFGTTVAEPALIAVSAKAAEVAGAAGFIPDSEAARADYAFELRLTVALSVGASLVLGVFRILKGWPIHYLIIAGYVIVVIITGFAPPEIVGIAYDSGGVTTSTMTARRRPGDGDSRPQPVARRLRPDRLRQPDADDLRVAVWNGGVMRVSCRRCEGRL